MQNWVHFTPERIPYVVSLIVSLCFFAILLPLLKQEPIEEFYVGITIGASVTAILALFLMP